MLSWILVGVLYLCGVVATFGMLGWSCKISGRELTWRSMATLLAWPLIIIAGAILGAYILVKGKKGV